MSTRSAIALLVTVLALAGCTGPDAGTDREQRGALQAASAVGALGRVSGPVVVAVGDIACPPGVDATAATCRQARTARLAKSFDPRSVLLLGDLQYDDGSLAQFRGSYADSWGDLRAISRPVPGNHEYHTPKAEGFFRYFRNQTPPHPGYYSFRVGTWRVYALNSNCDQVDCARQARWLDRAMTRHHRRCSAVMMHHPRYSSGDEHGSTPEVRPFWRVALRHRADVALAGHDHGYERFRRMNATGDPARRGMLSFVSGAGGRSLYGFGEAETGSMVRDGRSAGVLALRLGERRFAWEYRTIDGRRVDSGARRCV